jgi:hypothetical protein
MAVANTLAYYDTETLAAVKSFIVYDPGCKGLPGVNASAYLASLLVTKKKVL